MANARRRSGRGGSMGSDYQRAKDTRDTGKKWLKLPEGWSLFNEEADTSYKMDFLPYVVKDVNKHPEGHAMSDDVWYRFPYRVHRQVGSQKKDMICPETFGLPCPRCERVREIYGDPSYSKKKAKTLAGKYTASRRSLYIAKIVGGAGENWDKKMKNKKYIFDSSDWFFFKLLDKEIGMNDPDTKNFACLEAGYTLKVRFSADSFEGNTYAKPDRIDFKQRGDYPEKILKDNPCLDDIILAGLPTYDEMVEAGKDSPNSKEGAGKSGKSKVPQIPDDDALDDMDWDELLEVIKTHDLTSQVDPDDFDEDEDEDQVRDEIKQAFTEIYGDRPNADDDDDDDDDEPSFPDQDAIEDMDHDELREVVERFDLSIDPDDFDEDDDDEVEDFQKEICNAFSNKSKGTKDTKSDPMEDLRDSIDDVDDDDFKALKKICKAHDLFESLIAKLSAFKSKPEKLKKKMMKLVDKGGKSGSSSKGKDICPHGHTFGQDWGEFDDDCNEKTCKSFTPCWNRYDSDIPF